MKVVAVACF